MKDVIIIGAGPIGLACGIAAKEQGLSFTIFDKGTLVNSLYHYPLNMTFFSTSDRLEIGGVPFISQNPKPTRAEALEYYRRVCSHWALDPPSCMKPSILLSPFLQGVFLLCSEKGSYQCKHLVIATGFMISPIY